MTYLYATIPATEGGEVKHYEFQQSMKDDPFTHHPETGEPIRRVILGGWGLMTKKASSGTSASSSSGGSCGCGTAGCC